MLIKARVFANSKKDELIIKSRDIFEIKIKTKPINGKANKEIIKKLSEYFKVSKSKIKLIKGGRNRNKIFEILK